MGRRRLLVPVDGLFRHPLWMQSLDIEYDLSFFDTDPYEPMAGGSMSMAYMMAALSNCPIR